MRQLLHRGSAVQSFSGAMPPSSRGELFDRIVEREFYPEAAARAASRVVLEVLAYLHAQRVVHRDLKVLLRGERRGAGRWAEGWCGGDGSSAATCGRPLRATTASDDMVFALAPSDDAA